MTALESPGEVAAQEPLTWFVRLCDDQPEKVIVIAMCAVVAGAIGFLVLHRPVLGVLGFVMILASTGEFWLGTRFTLDSKSASAKCGFSLTSIEWENIKRVTVTDTTIRLSPLEHMTRMEPFRGVLLRILPQQREHVLEFVRAKCKTNVRILGTGALGSGGGGVNRESGEGDSPSKDGDSRDFGDRDA